MTNITFDDNLITGNDTIDTQHEELINRIQQFVAVCESGDGKVKAIKMLDYLDEYTNFHFQAEEELQKKVSYPELAKHQEQCGKIIETKSNKVSAPLSVLLNDHAVRS